MFDNLGKKIFSNHNHSHVTSHGYAFFISIILNTIFIIIEFTYGCISNSSALVADAGHNLSDVLALILAWLASILARKAPDNRYTYGLRSSTILAAIANAMFLLIVCGGIAWEAFQRLSQPPVITEMTVIVVSGIGILINGFSAFLFMKDSKEDLNIRGAYLHMAADAGISFSVMVAGIVMMITSWYWIDPVLTLIIVVIIVISAWGLLRESIQLGLNAVPANIDASAVEFYLRSCSGVSDLHDLHIWGMSTSESALTVHLVMPEGYPGDTYMDTVMKDLNDKYKIQHCTLQIEQGNTGHNCVLQPKEHID